MDLQMKRLPNPASLVQTIKTGIDPDEEPSMADLACRHGKWRMPG
jgi:hypothetical protein